MSIPKKADAVPNVKFGVFKGVFTPSVLTILGVIMYLRFGWVVGNAGIAGTILIVLLAHIISFATGMSISSIATNRAIRTGGDYYMISRSLGLPLGGAIGIALFFALAFSTSLYVIGFTESFLDVFGWDNTLLNRRIVGSITCLFLTALTYISTSLALRTQYFVLAAIALSLVSLFLGSPDAAGVGGSSPLWFTDTSASFPVVFAVFFPAVTGFTAGVAMSGDLRDPRRAIPLGTMAAITVGMIVYLAIPIYLGLTVDPAALRSDQMIWLRIARFAPLVIAGVFAATLSSAIGSVLGAPRYLQALSFDGIVPRALGKGYGPLNEPRIGTVVTFFIALAGILIGELDLIARVITMFFLTSYGAACLACGIQTWAGLPSFRPQFKTPAWVSFLGAFTCIVIMFMLDTLAMMGAIAAMTALYFWIDRKQTAEAPVDAWRGFWVAATQKGLMYLHRRESDGKNWRPNTVVFGGNPFERRHLVDFATWLFRSHGLTSYFYILIGSVEKETPRARQIEARLGDLLEESAPEMLTRVIVSESLYDGMLDVTQSYGFSGMTPNTVLMGWPEDTTEPGRFTATMRALSALDRNLFFLRYDDRRAFGTCKTIDIWWGGLDRNGELMLLLTYMLNSSEEWRKAKIRVLVVVSNADAVDRTTARLSRIIDETRIGAVPRVIVRDRPIAEIIPMQSGETDLVFMGLREPTTAESDDYIAHVSALLKGLGTVLLVRASNQFDASKVLFDKE